MSEQTFYIEDFAIDTYNLLGQGACGKVFAASRRNDNKQYCAKIVNANSQNVQKELDILNFMRNKQNENIVNVYYCNFVQERQFFVIIMEKCDSDLEKEIKARLAQQRRYTEQEAIEIMKQLFNGYRVLYQSQVVHRDIKPANILTSLGRYKIADFGVGKIYQSDQNLINMTKTGTPVYKAPELQGNYEYSPTDLLYIQGNPPRFSTNPSPNQGSTIQSPLHQSPLQQSTLQQSTLQQNTLHQGVPFKGTFEDKEKKVKLLHKVDIYSFGILFYHLLTGTYPFELSMSGINDFIQRLRNTPFKIPPQFNISNSTCQLVERMITYSPVERIDFPALSSWYGMRLGTMYNRDSTIVLPVKPAQILINPQKIVMILPQKSVQDWFQQYRNLFFEKCCESQVVIPIYRNYCDLCLNLAILQFEQTINLEQISDYIVKYQQANKCDIEFKMEAKLDKIYYIQEFCRVLKSQFIPKCFDYEQIKTYGESHLRFMFISSKLLKGYYSIQSFLSTQPPNYNQFKEMIQKDNGLTKEQYKQYLDDQF